MTIEFHKTEPEALIVERMKNGGSRCVAVIENVPRVQQPSREKRTEGDLIAALQASTYGTRR